jgi:hypothetical protein
MNNFGIDIYTGDLEGTPYLQLVNFSGSAGDLNLGYWNDFIIKIKFAKDTSGTLDMWKRLSGQTNFSNIFSVSGIPTLQYKTSEGTANADHYWKSGIYVSKDIVTTHKLYLDGFTRGTNYNDVVNVAF